MIITYLAMKCLRYNSLTSGNVDNEATQKSPHNSSISCKLTFTDKFNQKMDIPLSHLLHFYPPGSFNLQKQFVRLKGVITSLNEGLIHFPLPAPFCARLVPSPSRISRVFSVPLSRFVRGRFLTDRTP